MTPLSNQMRRLGRRLLVVSALAGTGWGLTTAAALLAAFAWIDLFWELSSEMRISGWVVAVIGGGVALVCWAVVALRGGQR